MADVLLTPAAITALYQSHGDVVWRRARSILGNDDEARDLVQEVFLQLLKHPERFEGRSAPSTWLYAVTTRAALQKLRDSKNRARLVDARAVELHPAASGNNADAHVDVRACLARLPEHIATVAVYSIVDGLSQDDIARVLDISRREVAARLARFSEMARAAQQEIA